MSPLSGIVLREEGGQGPALKELIPIGAKLQSKWTEKWVKQLQLW